MTLFHQLEAAEDENLDEDLYASAIGLLDGGASIGLLEDDEAAVAPLGARVGTSALSYLSLEVTIKPTAPDGILLYNGLHDNGQGEFMAVSMRDGHVEFAFDLGTGVTFVR